MWSWLSLHNPRSPCRPPTPQKRSLSNRPQSFDAFRVTAGLHWSFLPLWLSLSLPSPPFRASSTVFLHQRCRAGRLSGLAAGAAVTGTADTLNWLPWGSPLGGAEQGNNCGGMLKRTRAYSLKPTEQASGLHYCAWYFSWQLEGKNTDNPILLYLWIHFLKVSAATNRFLFVIALRDSLFC